MPEGVHSGLRRRILTKKKNRRARGETATSRVAVCFSGVKGTRGKDSWGLKGGGVTQKKPVGGSKIETRHSEGLSSEDPLEEMDDIQTTNGAVGHKTQTRDLLKTPPGSVPDSVLLGVLEGGEPLAFQSSREKGTCKSSDRGKKFWEKNGNEVGEKNKEFHQNGRKHRTFSLRKKRSCKKPGA